MSKVGGSGPLVTLYIRCILNTTKNVGGSWHCSQKRMPSPERDPFPSVLAHFVLKAEAFQSRFSSTPTKNGIQFLLYETLSPLKEKSQTETAFPPTP